MAYFLGLQYGLLNFIYLDGAGMASPVKGCQYSPGRGKIGVLDGVEVITEELKIDLVGTYRAISDFISALNTHLEIKKAGLWHLEPNGVLMLVLAEPDQQAGYFWRSPIVDARLELDPAGLAQRKTGQQKISLFLTRENRWENTDTNTLLISFPGGGTQLDYAGMANHKDATAGDSNWGWVTAARMEGDLKSKAAYQFMPGAGDYVGDVLMGISYADVGEPNVQYALPTLEETAFNAGAGVTKTSVASGACSGGNYATYAWNTVVETLLMTAAIPANTLLYALAFERPFKPIARLQAAWAVTDCWFKAKVIVTGTTAVVYETEWFLHPGNTQLLEFPPVYLPPAGMYETVGLDLAIYVMKATPGEYTLPFDYLQLWPVDGGFRKYKQQAYFGSAGQLFDLGDYGGVFWANYAATQKRATVIAYGPPVDLLPGRTMVVAIANLTSGTTWLIDDRITFFINHIPTKRNI